MGATDFALSLLFHSFFVSFFFLKSLFLSLALSFFLSEGL